MTARLVRRIVALVTLLGLLAWATSAVVGGVVRGWFEKEAALRATLVVTGARGAFVREWGDPAELTRTLEDITRDARIEASAVCDLHGALVARTRDYPAELGCAAVLERVGASRAEDLRDPATSVLRRGGAKSLLAAVVVRSDDGNLRGFVVLLHDLAYASRREAATQRYYLVGLAVLALLASLATLFFERATWRALRDDLRRVVRGAPEGPELAPLMRDVRDLAERLADETKMGSSSGWTPERLRDTLRSTLRGEHVVVVANREPYVHVRNGDRVEVLHPASGLVTALEPIMRACSGVWVAHGSGSADRETADARGRVCVPPGERLYTTRRVWLEPDEERGYYYGFSNEGLWPLCHLADVRPTFRSEDYAAYRTVNARFADAVAEELDGDDPIVLVQDYHLALVPRLLRQRIPSATLLTFWHIPWPTSERLGICPQHAHLLRGLLGSSIIGFQTQRDCNNFLDAVDRHLEARIDREQDAVVHQGHSTLVRAYPISIEWPNRWLSGSPPIAQCRASVAEEHGLGTDVKIGVGVDRVDYTKGIEERLLSIERLFELRPDLVGRFTFIQLGAPSRTKLAAYESLNERIVSLTDRINGRFGRDTWRPVVLHRAHHEPDTVVRYYRAADLCCVSSLHDGMNLVAKEFVSVRDDDDGVLVLSRFTGAARELTEALVVNPYDIDEASAALATALDMSRDERRARMRALRSVVAEKNVYRWAGRMLSDAARLRQGRRLAARLTAETRSKHTVPDRATPGASRWS